MDETLKEYRWFVENGINLEFIKEPMINTNSETDDVILKAIQQAVLEYDHLLKDEPEWCKRAKQFSKKLKDVSGILVDLEFHKQNLTLPKQVITYQDSCHLRNVMKTSVEPRILLMAIKNTEYREMKNADSCCGSAGIYNIVEPVMSMQILDSKMKTVATEATTIVTANPGCLLQMKLGIEREGLSDRVRAVQIADFLLEAVSEFKD